MAMVTVTSNWLESPKRVDSRIAPRIQGAAMVVVEGQLPDEPITARLRASGGLFTA